MLIWNIRGWYSAAKQCLGHSRRQRSIAEKIAVIDAGLSLQRLAHQLLELTTDAHHAKDAAFLAELVHSSYSAYLIPPLSALRRP